MMEHALFIRGLLDPTECQLINTANDFAMDYKKLLEMAKENVIMAKVIIKDNRGRRYEVRRPFSVLNESMYNHNIELS